MFSFIMKALRKNKEKRLRDNLGKFRRRTVNDDPVVQELVEKGRQKVFAYRNK